MSRIAIGLFLAVPLWGLQGQATEPVQLAQVIDERRSGQDLILKDSRKPDSSRQIPAGRVDLTGLWYHLHHHQTEAAKSELDRLERENPAWTAPPDVMRAIAASKPERSARPARDQAAASASIGWKNLKAGKAEAAYSWFAIALKQSGGRVGRDGMAWTLIALKRPDEVEPYLDGDSALGRSLADLYYRRAVERLKAGAADAGDLDRAVQLGRGGAYADAGWTLLDAGKPQAALSLFQRAEPDEAANYGAVLAQQKSGDFAAAEKLACGRRTLSARLASACADMIEQDVLTAYRQGRIRECIALGDQLAALAPERTASLPLVAWALFNSGQYQRAADLFAQLYLRDRNADLRQGVWASMTAAGREDWLADRIAAGDVALAAMAEQRDRAIAFDRKQFDLAEVVGRDGLSAAAGLEVRHSSGSGGLGRLDILGPRSEIQAAEDGVRLTLSLVDAVIAGGSAGPLASIGSRPAPDNASPNSRLQAWLPAAGLSIERPNWTGEAVLSSSPLGASLSAQPTGSISVTHYGERDILSGRFFSQDVNGSMLSFAGSRDPVTGKSWGRVIDSGMGVQGIYLPAERVSLAANAELARLVGIDVAENSRVALRGDAAYDFRPDGFDHLRLGPFLSFAHFERNLSGYTIGQGGYYSPDSDERAGLLLDLQTKENARWLVETKLSAAYAWIDDAGGAVFPLSASASPSFASRHPNGLSTDASLRAGLLVADHAALSGFGRYAEAAGYHDYSIGVMLTLSLEGRGGLVSPDLGRFSLTPFR